MLTFKRLKEELWRMPCQAMTKMLPDGSDTHDFYSA
jgi:hypothetical protein